MTDNKKEKKKKNDVAALFIPAGALLGLGVGFVADQIVGGLFIGLGLGFIGMIVTILVKQSKK